MITVICTRCGCSKEVHYTQYDSFKWQCRMCNTPNWHEGEVRPRAKRVTAIDTTALTIREDNENDGATTKEYRRDF
jgi:hypothetical protein